MSECIGTVSAGTKVDEEMRNFLDGIAHLRPRGIRVTALSV